MPWLSFPFGNTRPRELSNHFSIQGIPSLIIIDREGRVINKDGRTVIMGDPQGENFPWLPKPVEELNRNTASRINTSAW